MLARAMPHADRVLCRRPTHAHYSWTPPPGSPEDLPLYLLVIGSLDFAVLSEAMASVSVGAGRTVNAKLYRPVEWRRKLEEGNAFVAAVASGPKLFAVGDEAALCNARREEANRLRSPMQYQGADVDVPDRLFEALGEAVVEGIGEVEVRVKGL